MTRFYTCGFEMQTVTAGFEFDTVNGTPTIDATTKRSGAASMKCLGNAGDPFMQHTYMGTGVATNRFFRAYVRIHVPYVNNARAIFGFRDATNGNLGYFRINANNTLELWDEQSVAQQGSDSSALSNNTWYRLEMSYNRTTGALVGYIDGVSFASGSTITGADANMVRMGMIDNAAGDESSEFNFDDIAINDSAGSTTQTGLPGEGRLVIALPTGAGDNAADTGNASMINEIPPSDTATSGSTMIELDTTTSIGDYAMTDSSTLGIDSYDTITLVDVLARVREEAAGTSNYTLRIKSASGGTTTSSSSVDAGNATPRTNPSSTTAFQIKLVSTLDPTTGIAWTPTGTNSIDNMQCGAATTDGTPDIWVLWLGAYVEWVDQAAPGGTKKLAALGVG
jgi:hypothetical protein